MSLTSTHTMTIFKYEGAARMIDHCDPHVTRILGQNPSLSTAQGTASYLLQPPSDPLSPIILIDTSSPHTAAQYVDLVVAHLHHLGLESGVREIHFESAYATQCLDSLVPKEADAKDDAPEDPKARAQRVFDEAKLAILSRCSEDPRAMELYLTEYGIAPWVLQAARERKLPVVEHIILTHRHLDHVGAVGMLLSALNKLGLPPPKIWKMPSPDEAALQANPAERATTDQALIDSLPQGLYTPFSPFQPLHPVLPGLMISILDPRYRHLLKYDQDGRPKWNEVPEIARVSVRCLKSPGHTADSISLVMCEGERGVFTGDTALGEGQCTYTDVTSHAISVRTLAAIRPTAIYPGHGSHISSVQAHLAAVVDEKNRLVTHILELLAKLNHPGALHDALREYFIAEGIAAAKVKKEEREFLTGLPYVPGKKMRKAAYGTLRWLSDKGTVAGDENVDDGRGGIAGHGKYGYGKPLPEGFEGGLIPAKKAGREASAASPQKVEEPVEEHAIPDLASFKSTDVLPVTTALLVRLLLKTADDKAIALAVPRVRAHLDGLRNKGKVSTKDVKLPKIIAMEVVSYDEQGLQQSEAEEGWRAESV